jgi:N6-adenosine-specific RNA methylase IME4
VIWQEENILLDGHNRLSICEAHDIDFDIKYVSLPDEHAAKLWILSNQLGRRNLTDEQRTYYLGARYELEKLAHGGDRKSSGQNVHLKTGERIADEIGDNEKKVRRAAKYKKAIDTIEAITSPEIKTSILARETPITKKDAEQIASIANGNGGKKQEADPKRAAAILDEILSGNAKTVKQAMLLERNEAKKIISQNLPDEIYNVIYADPPWEYDNAIRQGGTAEMHYPTMPLNKICSFLDDIELQIDNNAVLFMWVTNPFLQDAFKVINSWGFKYKTNMVWVKTDLVKPGSGFYVRGRHELLFICTRGAFTPLDKNISPPIGSVIEADIQEHSRKPEDIYSIIETLYPGCNYIELFARNKRSGWASYGNEIS